MMPQSLPFPWLAKGQKKMTLPSIVKREESYSSLDEHLLESPVEDDDQGYARPVRPHRFYKRYWFLHLALFAVNLMVAIFLLSKTSDILSSHKTTSCKMRKFELDISSDAIEYEDRVFAASGFHERDNSLPTIYEGARSKEVDDAWEKLTTVGFVSLTKEQNDRLPNATVESFSEPGTYPVAIGAFHQLHCLNYIRIQLFPADGDGKGEDDDMRTHHKHHCLDYLRQVVQCHGDMTPLSVYHPNGVSGYAFDHAVTHSCRNWDRIYDWAVEHAAAIQIEG